MSINLILMHVYFCHLIPLFSTSNAVGIAPNFTICQASSTSLRIDWHPPMPLRGTTGYRVIYFTSEAQPIISSPPLSVGTTSYLLTDVVHGRLYFISVEGLSEHFSSEVVYNVTRRGIAYHCGEDGKVEMAAPSPLSPSSFIPSPSTFPHSLLFLSPTTLPLSLSSSPLATLYLYLVLFFLLCHLEEGEGVMTSVVGKREGKKVTWWF